MITISLCMIVRDESLTLARCLDCVKDTVDEIVIVDTGSVDNTKQIALRYTDKVYDFLWVDDFSAARNFAFSKGKSDFLMWLDADDIITKPNIDKLKELKKEISKDTAAVYMYYDAAFDTDGENSFSFYRERLVNRDFNPLWQDAVHETIFIEGKKLYCDIRVEHRKLKNPSSGRNLKIIESEISKGKTLSPRMHFYYARELMYNGRTQEAIAAFEEYLSGGKGWVENEISASRDLSFCYEKAGRDKEALKSALWGLSYALPRAELLCRIGELFLKQKKFEEARYWYERAIDCDFPQKCMGFVEKDYYGYIPALQLCVIYHALKEYSKAEEYNERAGNYKLNSSAYLYNKKYFENLKRN